MSCGRHRPEQFRCFAQAACGSTSPGVEHAARSICWHDLFSLHPRPLCIYTACTATAEGLDLRHSEGLGTRTSVVLLPGVGGGGGRGRLDHEDVDGEGDCKVE